MTAEYAERLYAQDHEHEGGISSCAELSLAAILPFKPSQRSLEIARYNYGNLEILAILATHELLVHGIVAEPMRIEDEEQASHFFRHIYREVTHLRRSSSFIGALMETKDEVQETSHISAHVIAVTKLHKNRKATVFDLMPRTASNPTNPLTKKVPWEALDRRITQVDGETRALALVAFNWLILNKAPQFFQNVFERRIREGEALVDEIERQGREIHTQTLPWLEAARLLAGRTKRRYRMDRRMQDIE